MIKNCVFDNKKIEPNHGSKHFLARSPRIKNKILLRSSSNDKRSQSSFNLSRNLSENLFAYDSKQHMKQILEKKIREKLVIFEKKIVPD